ncbi:hypothetical protein GQ53DRAFT_728144 [Thozetella sp. PMI_491]|nr:hypothetical protein GQ53DRAFT_728144 [Thozetella sp. PMI_491]
MKLSNVAVTLAAVAPAAADCTRDTLIKAADAYVAAQGQGALGDLEKLLTPDYKVQQNNKASSATASVLGTALKVAHRKTTADTVNCASYTEVIATTPKPYVIGTQLRHTPDGASITLIDIIAATTGALRFDAAKTLSYIEKEQWTEIDASKRDSRALLQQVGDAYLDMWTNASAINAIPWGTPCERVEGSSHNSPCTVGAPKGGSSQRNSNRRYVIDEVLGSCDIHCAFSAVGGVADSHEFRLENGKLRYVHTITL